MNKKQLYLWTEIVFDGKYLLYFLQEAKYCTKKHKDANGEAQAQDIWNNVGYA